MLKGVVVGTGRSGTTLLVNLLGSHPRLSPMYELEFITDIIHWFRESGQVQAKKVLGLLYGWGSSLTGLPFREIWDKAYDKKKPRFGSKYALFTKTELMTAGTVFLDQLKELPAEKALAGLVNTLVGLHCKNDGKPWCVLKVPALIRAPDVFSEGFPGVKFVHILRDGRDVWCSARNYWWGPKTIPNCAQWWSENIRVADLIHREYPGMMLEIKYEN
ncbi:MAG: sulfotransferase, partial [Planctomycetes bacterium]|nr:sulfotransferase [Planctomycetota bacterium]